VHATQRFGESAFDFLLGAKATDPLLAPLAFVVGLKHEHVAVGLASHDDAAQPGLRLLTDTATVH